MNDDPGYCRNDQRNRHGAGEAMNLAPLEGYPYREQDGRETKTSTGVPEVVIAMHRLMKANNSRTSSI